MTSSLLYSCVGTRIVTRALDSSLNPHSKYLPARSHAHGNPLRITRRGAMELVSLSSALSLFQFIESARGQGLPFEAPKQICDSACEKELENVPIVTTPSGLQYKDIVVGNGPTPPVGYQVAANYVAMVSPGKVFDSSLEKGTPYIFRVGAGTVVKGLDEGILTMKVGGKRRLYIPGDLAFPKGLNAAAGRPRVLPKSPVIFDASFLSRMYSSRRNTLKSFLSVYLLRPFPSPQSMLRPQQYGDDVPANYEQRSSYLLPS